MKVGEHDLSTNNDDAKLIKVKKIHNHPNYNNPVSLNNDFSILELDEDLTFSESVRPACLPQSDASTYAELDGKSTVCYLLKGIPKKHASISAVVSGWGTLSQGGSSPKILQEITVKVLENSNCGDIPSAEITNQMMCATAPNNEAYNGVCHGDSGGPLVTKLGGRYSFRPLIMELPLF